MTIIEARDQLYAQIRAEVDASREQFEEQTQTAIHKVKQREFKRRIQPQAGEVRAKEWIAKEAKRRGCSPENVWYHIRRGHYPNVKVRSAARCVAFLTITPNKKR